jgi:hypothetical protein
VILFLRAISAKKSKNFVNMNTEHEGNNLKVLLIVPSLDGLLSIHSFTEKKADIYPHIGLAYIAAVAEGVIVKEPTKREIFRHKNDYPKTTIDQLENLGFCPDLSESQDDEKISLKDLYSARNDFAHRSILPTFQQTFGAMKTLKSFVEEMPEILQGLK